MASPEAELARLRGEVHAKDETLSQLKLKTKAFVDNMRAELVAEKKRVAELEQQLKSAQGDGGSGASASADASGELQRQVEGLRKELEAATHREQELKARAKTFADGMKAQLAAEKDKARRLEAQLEANASAGESSAGGEELATAQQQVAEAVDRLRNTEAQAAESASLAEQLRRELAALQQSGEQQRAQLQGELELLQSHADSQRSSGSAALEEAERRGDELGRRLEQYKIESEHLQKQLLDKDFQLEQLDTYRQQAAESDARELESRAEAAALRVQLQRASDERASERSAPCSACASLALELETAQQRAEELARQNVRLGEQLAQREASEAKLREDAGRLMTELAELQAQLGAAQSASGEARQRSEAAADELQALRQRAGELERANRELGASVAAAAKDSQEKRQKAKALVMALSSDKQALTDAKAELLAEVDRLRTELNARNAEADKRLRALQEESARRLAQSSTSIQSLSDEVSTLRQALALVQESERNQQRAKELAGAKREVEDANKKRLAAKAETQKLAVELEGMHKCLTHLAEHAAATCLGDVRRIGQLHDRVADALHVLEKRAAAGKKPAGAPSGTRDAAAEDLRGPEAVAAVASPPRSPMGFPASGTKKVEDSISQVDERLQALADAVDKLCDLAVEQNDVGLKDVLVDKVSQLFTHCFSEGLRAAYTKVDDSDAAASIKSGLGVHR